MIVTFDIEANSLTKPDRVHLIVCKELLTGFRHIFRNVTSDADARLSFKTFATGVTKWVGHNVLEYDFPVLRDLGILDIPDAASSVVDTLIISRLVDFARDHGHSIAQYGEEFGCPKGDWNNFKEWSQELEDYCIRDVDICEKIFLKYRKYIDNPAHRQSIELEHKFQLIANDIQDNGFCFNTKKAEKLLEWVTKELATLDKAIFEAFPPRLKPIREITPRLTKYGTLNRNDFRWHPTGDLSGYSEAPFTLCEWVEFNPSSHKQIIEVLNAAGWKPEDKTKTHIDTLRELSRQKWTRTRDKSVDLAAEDGKLVDKLEHLKKFGWRVNETNLSTLPESAPLPARSLAKRIMLEARRRTLTEWLSLVDPATSRIHGRFQALGTWTHRSATQKPNLQNIPNEFDTEGKVKLLGKEFRQLFCAPKNRLLVGVDAEGIQLRIFAHYINDPEFTDALVRGKKSDKTDPHSFNQRIIGSVCKSRAAAKRFIYAMLLGASKDKLAQVLDCSLSEAEEAFNRILARYGGWELLRRETFPKDARRGYFEGLDGRKVAIPGDNASERRHLALSGYLQNGEAIVMRYATVEWYEKLAELASSYPGLAWKLVDLIHDEWQTEVPNDIKLAKQIAEIQCDALRVVGERLNLKCPLAGSYYNDDHHDFTIGTNWYQTH